MTELKRIEVVMEGGPVGPELQVVNMDDGPFYYADEADKRIAELEANPLYDERIALHQAYLDRGKRVAELEAREEKYTELVAAAVAWHDWLKSVGGPMEEHVQDRLYHALQPFLPVEKRLSEKLTELADNGLLVPLQIKRLRELAQEAEKLENKDD